MWTASTGDFDKAKVYWDNVNERWHFKKGSADAPVYTGGLYSESASVKVGGTYEALVSTSNAVSPSDLGSFSDFQSAYNTAKT